MKTFDLKVLKNPRIFEQNTIEPHTNLRTDKEYCFEGENPTAVLLNGKWKFKYSEKQDDFKGFEQNNYDVSDWGLIPVPGEIDLNCDEREPYYINLGFTFNGRANINQPDIPKEIPTGYYVLDFDMPVTFKKTDRKVICFQGVETAFAVYLNGEYIGYSEDSFTPAEFDLTDYIKPKSNRLAVKVFRYSTATWLEDQDFWRMFGIFRDVVLYRTNRVYIEDFHLKYTVENKYKDVKCDLTVSVENTTDSAVNYTIKAMLSDVFSERITVEVPAHSTKTVNLPFTIENATLWNCENPYLYELLIKDKYETIKYDIGFKEIKIDGVKVTLNGKTLKIHGVNRHEWSAEGGRSITREQIKEDVLNIKRNNMNAIRTSHYPNHPYFYELCDKIGLYVMDETNLETHGSWNYGGNFCADAVPGDFDYWTGAVVRRAENMVMRDKNHACIISWSLGNESYDGENFKAMRRKIDEIDGSLPVHYEGICHGLRDNTGVSDFKSMMYQNPDDLAKQLENKEFDQPYLSVEYAHAMGNSVGDLFKYTNLENYDGYLGGFIWDYIDQGLYNYDSNGNKYIAYGGQFDAASETTFCGNGIVNADRTNTPEMQEVKACYSFVKIEPQKDKVKLTNNYCFTNLNAFYFKLTVLKNGEQITVSRFTVNAKPGETAEYNYKLPNLQGEIAVIVSMHQKAQTEYANKDYEIAFGQYCFTEKEEKESKTKGGLEIFNSRSPIKGVKGKDFYIAISTKSGAIHSYKYKGKELLHEPIRINFWRASTDNDRGNEAEYKGVIWKNAGTYTRYTNFVSEIKDGNAVYSVKFKPFYDKEVFVTVVTTVFPDGSIKFDYEYSGADNMPKFPCAGLMISLKKEYSHLQWYGLGKEHTYCDKYLGGKIGIHSTDVEEQLPKYLRPQEYGNHYDTRWLKVYNDNDRGIIFKAEKTLDMSAISYTPDEIESATTNTYLPTPYCTRVYVNGFMSGVGGDTSWGAPVHEEFTHDPAKPIKFSFTMKPFDK